MSVQAAVEQREQHQAPAAVDTATVVKNMITRQAKAFGAVLPPDADVERYSRLTLVAIKANPKLMAAFSTQQGQVSVLLSAMQAAALGLEPNTPTQECWLQPRRTKDANGNWVDECELSIGYRGYAKLARRSGTIKELFADVVRVGDEFEYERGLDADLFRHKSKSDEGDELTHAYAIARFHDGGSAWVVLTRKQVEKRRAMAESWKNEKARPYSPWTKWEEEQWCKTAMRNLLMHGQVELSPQLVTATATDERPLAVGDDGMIDALVLEDPTPTAALGESSSVVDTEPEQKDAPPATTEDAPPASEKAPPLASDVDILRLASEVFDRAREAAPRGEKSKTLDRLRHCMVWAVSAGRTVHLKELSSTEKHKLWMELAWLKDGFNTWEATADALVLTHKDTEIVVSYVDVEAVEASDTTASSAE